MSTLVKRVGDRLHAKCPRCKSWNCPECAPGRRRQLIDDLIQPQPEVMITPTLKPRKGETRPEHAQRFAANVARFMIKLRKETGRKFPYAIANEGHKSGFLHAHIMVYEWKYFHRKKLCAIWRKITGDSWQVDVRRIDPGRAVHYATKYMAKAPVRYGRMKRYRFSQNWERKPKREIPVADRFGQNYTMNMGLRAVIDHFTGRGGELESLEGNLAIIRAPP